jgi:hypothetical protein
MDQSKVLVIRSTGLKLGMFSDVFIGLDARWREISARVS